MYDNGTLTDENTVSWMLAKGDNNASTICSNYSAPEHNTIPLLKDAIAGVRYSYANNNSVSGLSDFVWVQVELNIPYTPRQTEGFSGSILIHFRS